MCSYYIYLIAFVGDSKMNKKESRMYWVSGLINSGSILMALAVLFSWRGKLTNEVTYSMISSGLILFLMGWIYLFATKKSVVKLNA